MLRHVVKMMILLSISHALYGLPSDREKVMNVVADSANLNQQEHKGEFNGHVQFVQGTTHLHAAQAITQGNEKNQLIVAIAKGDEKNQAHYWTLTDPAKPQLHAYADTIYYYPLKHLITLTGHARIVQGKNSFSAATISYDTLKQRVVSESDGQTRTTIVIYPDKKMKAAL
ncbi:OstA family protein [Legionella israelensis]|uniref:OstA family protein n=2 Tax=Legionella israelensis TaxID=454 RepID=A0A0W0WI80_9GAMM|nr:lipopolysaccharide transport periplasmic protein LptA [Legionella israelensis]KTD31939.1 OstA family protein [Legionella israelensis]QBS10741.1 lipopolysaccharide transport periplasmic protein LptA [Legionella israelensis]SCY28318.1 lipopolysaccharide export system protein LptA [Legionella israelensis DSM 19235]STX57708.1 OstA family protein [Legionella israelensis]